MNEIIVIYVAPTRTTVVQSWKKPLSPGTLQYQAPGLDFHVVKAKGVRLNKYDHERIGNLALQECISRHIPLLSLRRVR